VSLASPKGTHDLLPEDLATWQWLEATARELCSQFNYQEIRTPILEHTELFARGVGETTDIVNKEMYSFEKGERQLTLRPENTAGVVRSFMQHGMSRWPKPVKLFYMGPMFRYERPQAGRQRQFHQFGVELFGLDTPQADADVILLAVRFLEKLGLQDVQLQINSLGDSGSRQAILELLRAELKTSLPTLCEDCQRRYETNALRMLDCKVPTCQAEYQGLQLAEKLATVIDASESGPHFRRLLELLDGLNIRYTRNPQLVRGLDYYTNTVFEITSNHLGSQNAVCGGGRYNGLIKTLGGADTPAIGWAMGIERLVSLIQKQAVPQLDYFIVCEDQALAFELAERIRKKGLSVEIDLSGRNENKQFQAADKAKPSNIVVVKNSGEVSLIPTNLPKGEVAGIKYRSLEAFLAAHAPLSS
jgi:histidyl-tRNA synthetase